MVRLLPLRACALVLVPSLALGAAAALNACAPPGAQGAPGASGGSGGVQAGENPAGTRPEPQRAPVLGYRVVKRYPHDKGAYTQGLLIIDDELYESTGKNGESSVRRVDLKTGKVERKTDLDRRFFGEGLAPYKALLVMLTWREHTAIVYDRKRLKEQYRYTYEGEGWGLTFDGEHFWMSDGTHELRVLDPDGFKELRRVPVTDGGRRVLKINELEWIDGELWANIWQTDRIARIDPKTGHVVAWIDCAGILGDYRVRDPRDEVLNGIAWDAKKKKLYITGKRWPWLFEVEIVDPKAPEPSK